MLDFNPLNQNFVSVDELKKTYFLQFWVKFSENNLKANEPHGSQKSFNTRK
jgi:hypothetical protein